MDELTRERFWPKPGPPRASVAPDEDVIGRQLVLLGVDELGEGDALRQARMRGDALIRSRRLANAIRVYTVGTTS